MTRRTRSPARPQEGGRYIRQKNGALRRVAETAAAPEPPALEQPAQEPPAEEQGGTADTEIPPEDAADSEQEG